MGDAAGSLGEITGGSRANKELETRCEKESRRGSCHIFLEPGEAEQT